MKMFTKIASSKLLEQVINKLFGNFLNQELVLKVLINYVVKKAFFSVSL